ncbi:MAG TPA: GNAT family N-acetyltransferase [Caulobacteraceae bacterium]
MTVLKDNPAKSRFEWDEDGHIAFADYRRADGRLIIDHVEAPRELRGTGAAGRLMEALAERARREGVKITPLCGYAKSWLQRDPDNAALIG